MAAFALREKFGKLKEKIAGFSVGQRFASNERGLALGGIVVVATILAIFGIVLGMMGALQLIMEMIADKLSLGNLLIHTPPFATDGFSLASYPDSVETGGLFHVSRVMSDLYPTFMTIAYAILAVAFVVLGLTYALEQFNVVRRGTVEKLLSESVLILILLFIFPWIFNLGAVAMNGLNKDIIMYKKATEDNGLEEDVDYSGMTADVAKKSADFPALIAEHEIGGIEVGDPSKAITAVVCATATFMAFLIALTTGVFRILAIGAFGAAFPIILALRLLPPIRRVADRIISGLIGLILATFVIALFFRVGWEVLEFGELGSFMEWALAVAILITASGAMTLTAAELSGMSAEISGTLGRSTAAAIGGYVATGATAGLGMATAGAAGGTMAIRGGMGAKAGAAAVGRSALAGLKRGGPGKDVLGSMERGWGGGMEAAKRATKDNLPMGGDIETTQENISGHMDTPRKNVGALSPEAKKNARTMGETISARGIHNLKDERVADVYGQHEMGERYNPKVHRNAVMEKVPPREIKEAMIGSYSDVKKEYGKPAADRALAAYMKGPDADLREEFSAKAKEDVGE